MGDDQSGIGHQFTADWPLRVIAEGSATLPPHNWRTKTAKGNLHEEL
jgi:hypothetical protein